MIFSYGFLEEDRAEAKQVFLAINIPSDDPLAAAKKMVCQDNPGILVSADGTKPEDRVPNGPHHTIWDSPLIWWASVNEEDGLRIGVVQTTIGTQELEPRWKGEKIHSPRQLRDFLARDPLWDIFQLRAVVLVLECLETQLSLLQETEEVLSNLQEKNQSLLDSMFRPDVYSLIARLRNLEAALLQQAVEQLLKQASHHLYCGGQHCCVFGGYRSL